MSKGPEFIGDVETPGCCGGEVEQEESEVRLRMPLFNPETPGGLRHPMVGHPFGVKSEKFDGSEKWEDYLVYFEHFDSVIVFIRN